MDNNSAGQTMRAQIKLVAEELLVKHGYRGLSFRQIAEILNTTRANLHYHFGSKDGLVEEVLEDYSVSTMNRYRDVLTDTTTTLRTKIEAIIKLNRERYLKYNPDGDHGNPWSLMTRLRSDSDALNDKMRNRLQAVMREFEMLVSVGVRAAVQSGELQPDTPQEHIVIQLVTIIHYAGLVTRDNGKFGRLTDLWDATLTGIDRAYGRKAKPRKA
ncbi:TetR/AcrR family transcriptional regulator [Ferrovibrio sp.]|uniref:TetR/AcrR family transcriptional regulator n=1 Tax=Ferrovibrio sp. TaxID=1917215 RepID=UPI001B7B2F8D|nr:TetR/AcrR family transcriptional regulator [Ferrovibrio sp.]MBP7065473.1 TetR/AcrR family transcriptional regulator [Ferrovibrio sp.]